MGDGGGGGSYTLRGLLLADVIVHGVGLFVVRAMLAMGALVVDREPVLPQYERVASLWACVR
jgi:hypothetical protein